MEDLQFDILLLVIVVATAAIVIAVDVILRGGARRTGGGLADADEGGGTDAGFGPIEIEPAPENTVPSDQPDRLYHVYEPTQLLDVDHLRGMDIIEQLLAGLTEAVTEARRRPRRRLRRPTSILLHGPPGGAMTIMSHVLARRFRARLVQLFATRALPQTNGGSQPLIAIAVNEARDHLPSVLMIDELEQVAAAEIRDADKQRAANDLVDESLQPMYGASHLVVALLTTYDDSPVPRRLEAVFEHILRIDVPEIERALLLTALQTADGDVFRAIPGARLAQRQDVAGGGWASAA